MIIKHISLLVLAMGLFSAASASESGNQNANSSLRQMRLGKGICVASLWGSIPGAYYQYAAQRDLETETINCAAMIRDGNAERMPIRGNTLASIRLTLPF